MKYTYFYKILIICTLYKYISNTIGSINLESKTRQSNNKKINSKRTKVRKAYLDYENLIDLLKQPNILNCTLFDIEFNYIINSINQTSKNYYFIELTLQNNYYYYFYEKKEQNDYLNNSCNKITKSYKDSQIGNFTDYYRT